MSLQYIHRKGDLAPTQLQTSLHPYEKTRNSIVLAADFLICEAVLPQYIMDESPWGGRFS